MKRTSAQKLKISIIITLLLIESTALTVSLIKYAVMGSLIPSATVLLKIALLMLLILYTHTMTVGAWGSWEQYVLGPVPIALGISMPLSLVNPTHARNMGILSALLIFYYTLRSLARGNLLINFVPGVALRKVNVGILLVFSIVCASVVLIDPRGEHVANLEKKVSEIITNKAESFAIKDLGTSTIISPMGTTMNIRDQLQKDLNDSIAPYRNAIAPIMAILIFSMVQAIGTAVYLVFSITVDWLFWLAKKTGFIKLELIPVQQEKPTF